MPTAAAIENPERRRGWRGTRGARCSGRAPQALAAVPPSVAGGGGRPAPLPLDGWSDRRPSHRLPPNRGRRRRRGCRPCPGSRPGRPRWPESRVEESCRSPGRSHRRRVAATNATMATAVGGGDVGVADGSARTSGPVELRRGSLIQRIESMFRWSGTIAPFRSGCTEGPFKDGPGGAVTAGLAQVHVAEECDIQHLATGRVGRRPRRSRFQVVTTRTVPPAASRSSVGASACARW